MTNAALLRRPDTAFRLGALALILGPLLFFLTEFIAAAAWTDPPYSYTYHFVSNLGVPGPAAMSFGQLVYSPLYWVMNVGFFWVGLIILGGLGLILRHRGWRTYLIFLFGAVLAAGGVLLALFPGNQAAMDNGTILYHGLGAQAAVAGGNGLAILMGTMRNRLGFSPRAGRWLSGLGMFGLLAFVVFLVDVRTGTNVLIGLFERGGIYPFLIAHMIAGTILLKRLRGSTLY
jgi:hypothetical protein